jgi:hypothetical protein
MEVQQSVTRFGFLFARVLQAEVEARKLIPVIVPATLPCNLICILDQRLLHIAFTPAGGMPNYVFIDRRSESDVTPEGLRHVQHQFDDR